VVIAALAFPGVSGASKFLPAKGKIYTGVTDDGTLQGFENFAEATGKHPAILQTYHPWGNGLDLAFQRWQNAEVLPMLHMSTADDETRAELITPQEIAIGAGDPYLIQINRFFSENRQRAFIRPLGEPNRCINPYSAFACSGRKKGGEHKTFWYRQAFRRIALITRGGISANSLDRNLKKLGMRKVNWGAIRRPAQIPKAPVSIVWSTLPSGSPEVKGNYPAFYWPGRKYVDWVGTDFYSNYPYWKDLNRFVHGKRFKGKPISLTEWGVTGWDDVRFVNRLFKWVRSQPRVRMMVYYRGFGEDAYYPYSYPRAIRAVKKQLKSTRFIQYAKGYARRR
jgi:hypothetical protein